MMLIISGRYGTVVSYLRAMFLTPIPTLETSSLPRRRRPGASGAGVLLDADGCASARAAMPPRSGAAARVPADSRKERRPMSLSRSVAMFERPLAVEVAGVPRRIDVPCGEVLCVLGYRDCALAASSVTSMRAFNGRSEEHTSELQSPCNLVCRLLL